MAAVIADRRAMKLAKAAALLEQCGHETLNPIGTSPGACFDQERHLYSRSNFKGNRTAALAEWLQLLAA